VRRNWLRYVLLGLAAYLAFLAVLLPARWLAPHLPSDIRLQGVTGTPWRGHAERVEYAGYAVDGVDWRIQAPYRLVLGSLSWRLRIERGALSGFVDLGLSPGRITLENTDLNLNLKLLEDALSGLRLRLDGRPIHLQAEVLELRRDGPGAARGMARWEHAALRSPVGLALGNLNLELTDDDQGWLGTLSNDSNQLHIGGTIRVLQGWAWNSEIRLSPGPEADASLRQALPLLGRPDRHGTVTLKANGTLTGPPGAQ